MPYLFDNMVKLGVVSLSDQQVSPESNDDDIKTSQNLDKQQECPVEQTQEQDDAKQPSSHPEQEWLFPAEESDWPCSQPVKPEDIAKVDAIRDKAMTCGWTETALYQNRGRYKFPIGPGYGLICFVGDARIIGKVTEKHIEILLPEKAGRQAIQKFYNPDTPQPWIK
jgi:hypothetical protein